MCSLTSVGILLLLYRSYSYFYTVGYFVTVQLQCGGLHTTAGGNSVNPKYVPALTRSCVCVFVLQS